MNAFWAGHVCQGQKTTFEGWFLHATMGDLGSDSSHWACMQALLPTELPISQVHILLFM